MLGQRIWKYTCYMMLFSSIPILTLPFIKKETTVYDEQELDISYIFN